MAIAEVSITPLGTADTSLSTYVASCLRIARESGLVYQLTPMGTILEGEIDLIFKTVRNMQESVFALGAERVSTAIKIDDRRDCPQHSMQSKIAAVEAKLR